MAFIQRGKLTHHPLGEMRNSSPAGFTAAFQIASAATSPFSTESPKPGASLGGAQGEVLLDAIALKHRDDCTVVGSDKTP
jgi:hypothetical protein